MPLNSDYKCTVIIPKMNLNSPRRGFLNNSYKECTDPENTANRRKYQETGQEITRIEQRGWQT